jgi:hypothetical protein
LTESNPRNRRSAEWFPVRVSDYRLRRLRDAHYSTDPRYVGGRTVGAPGKRLAFVTFEGDAGWISHYCYSGLGDGYVCSLFRNEGAGLSSDLIAAAIEATEERWGKPSRWLTLVDPKRVRHKRDPGRCFRRAGFRPAGYTKERRLLILELTR